MNFDLLSVEILTAILGLGLLVLGLILPPEQRKGLGYLAALGLTGILVSTLFWWGAHTSFLEGAYLIDPYSTFFKQIFLAAAVLVVIASQGHIHSLDYNQGAYYSLIVFATLGMMVLASAGDLISLYVGLELMTITFCILASFHRRDSRSAEAGLKYIILGALSSTVLLYGLTFLYGLTQTTNLREMVSILSQGPVQPLLLLAITMLLSGFAFKISAVPFHMWSPDIYEGSPTPVTAFLAVASKAAGFAVLLRVFMIVLGEYQPFWNILVVVLAVLTIILGNLVAIPQKNIKRLLAYSSISQAGYLLLGMIAFSSMGVGAILFHSALYVFANMGAFMVVIAVGHATGSDQIKDYSGLAQRSPVLAATMLFSMLSLAGIPPLAGFISKFYLFTAVIEQGYVWLALLAVLMSMVSVYYYLLVAKAMYLNEPEEGAEPIRTSGGFQLAMLVSLAIIVFFGIYPAPLTEVAMNVAQTFFK